MVILPGKSEKSEFVNRNYPEILAKNLGFFRSELAGRI